MAINISVKNATTATREVQVVIKKFSLLYVLVLVSLLVGQGLVHSEGKITYLTADRVYCDLGSNSGAAVGDTMTVFRRDQELGLIVVTNVARKSAVCLSLVPTSIFQLGDRVVLDKTSLPEPVVPEEVAAKPQPAAPKKHTSLWTQSGNISFRYTSSQFSDKTADNRGIGSFNYRLRSGGLLRATFWLYGRSNTIDNSFSLYQARMTLGRAGSRFYLQAGRVFAPELAGIGSTDGILLSSRVKSNLSVGVLAGVQPDPKTLAFDPNLKKAGGYVYLNKRTDNTRTTANLALVGQYAGSKTDREFIYWSWRRERKSRLSLSLNQTVDVYRHGKVRNRNQFTPTSSQLSLRFRPFNSLTLQTRYTGRRQVVYQKTGAVIPDSLFKDELRSGLYTSVRWSNAKAGSFQLGANIRTQKSEYRPAILVALDYRSPQKRNNSSYSIGTSLLRNDLLTGLRAEFGYWQQLAPGYYFNVDYDLYSYGYGNKIADYIQHHLSASVNRRFFARLNLSLSGDYTYDRAYQIFYFYAGVNYRL
ncbi:MAG: hypothetical protein ACE5D2_08470 [Fidelibacterota bacterium]